MECPPGLDVASVPKVVAQAGPGRQGRNRGRADQNVNVAEAWKNIGAPAPDSTYGPRVR